MPTYSATASFRICWRSLGSRCSCRGCSSRSAAGSAAAPEPRPPAAALSRRSDTPWTAYHVDAQARSRRRQSIACFESADMRCRHAVNSCEGSACFSGGFLVAASYDIRMSCCYVPKRVLMFTIVAILAAFFVAIASAPTIAQTQIPPALTIKTLGSVKITALPAGSLFWRLETFPTLVLAQSAAGPSALAVQSGGRNWLITLGSVGGATAGGTQGAEVGRLPAVKATNYLLQVNEASGPPGAITAQHSHPGSETFYVLNGETTSRTPEG